MRPILRDGLSEKALEITDWRRKEEEAIQKQLEGEPWNAVDNVLYTLQDLQT